MSKTKVLVIDDSALMRQVLTEILSKAPDLEVVGAAADPYQAREKILALKPDVLTLDVEMPRMDGLTFLGKLMRSRPMPVVMVSTLTEKGCDTTLKSLELGAVDFVTKPRIDMSDGMVDIGTEIVEKVRTASRAKVTRAAPLTKPDVGNVPVTDALITSTHKIIAIGASTGGTQALMQVLPHFPSNTPGVVVVIHMPATFTGRYAKRLDELCHMNVKEAKPGDVIIPGQILIAPGSHHMTVKRSGARYRVALNDDPPVNQFKPSVDVLFHSVAKFVGTNAVGCMLTGMGQDGAEGMLAMKRAGATNFAQDEKTCVVFGMPKAAIQKGGVDQVLPLSEMAMGLLSKVRQLTDAVTK